MRFLRHVHRLRNQGALQTIQCFSKPTHIAGKGARLLSTLPKIPIFEAITSHEPQSTAVIHSASRRTFTYSQLLHDVSKTKDRLSQEVEGRKLEGERIAFMAENGYDYVGAQRL